jgi:pantetheine-phosphate adenylyltransferase
MSTSDRIAICAGSFDPPTNGHLDVVRRAARLFHRVIVAVLVNSEKQPWFAADERVAMLVESLEDAGVEVATFDGLLVDFAHTRGASVLVRGLRTATEYSDEQQMAMMNRHLGGIETVFIPASPEVAFISSRMIKDVVLHGGTVDGLVPPPVARRLAARGASAEGKP